MHFASWNEIIPNVLVNKPHQDIVVPQDAIHDPELEGIAETLGEPQGQLKDYEITLPDGKRVHIRKFLTYYTIHWDIISPAVNAIEHLRYDAPQWWVALTTICGTLTGAYLSKNKQEGALVGGLLGLVFGLATLPKNN